MSFFIRRDGCLVSTDEAYAWLEASRALAEESKYDEAMTQALKALSWFQSTGPSSADDDGLMQCHAGEGASLSQIASICAACENWKEAARYFQKARDAWMKAWEYEEAPLSSVNAEQNTNITCLNLALAAGYLKKYEESIQIADGAFSFFAETEDINNQIQALMISAGSNAALRNQKMAAEKYRSALRLAREIGDARLEKVINSQLKRVLK
jgi:tetratricopeptide (TPR) repeat protein